MEHVENTVANNAGIAKRAIERILETHDFEIDFYEMGLDKSNIGQLKEVLDTLAALHSMNSTSLNVEKEALEAANSDGFMFNEYNEYNSKK